MIKYVMKNLFYLKNIIAGAEHERKQNTNKFKDKNKTS